MERLRWKIERVRQRDVGGARIIDVR